VAEYAESSSAPPPTSDNGEVEAGEDAESGLPRRTTNPSVAES